jgi:hypothetical protein
MPLRNDRPRALPGGVTTMLNPQRPRFDARFAERNWQPGLLDKSKAMKPFRGKF